MTDEERTAKMAELKQAEQYAERHYSDMYEYIRWNSVAGAYSYAKDWFAYAISLAKELELTEEEARLKRRLDEVTHIARNQFPKNW